MIKLKDLARELGLSQTTVSRALNGYPEVSERTRQRVRDAANRLNYRPNASARRLATGRAGAIGAVLPTDRNLLVDPHFVEFLAGLGERLAEDEIDILLSPAGTDEMATYRRMASGTRADLLVLSGPMVDDPRITLMDELGFPIIVHGRPRDGLNCAWLDIDNFGAFEQATRYLLDLGHRRIGLINGDARMTFASDRAKGYAKALKDRGLSPDPALTANDQMTDSFGYRAMQRFLEVEDRPTGVVVSSMMMALGAFRALRAAGLELGKDVSIVAHDDVFPYLNPDRMVPPMTTTRSPIRAAGTRLAELATEMLTGRAAATIHEEWPVELIIRGSTAPPPSSR